MSRFSLPVLLVHSIRPLPSHFGRTSLQQRKRAGINSFTLCTLVRRSLLFPSADFQSAAVVWGPRINSSQGGECISAEFAFGGSRCKDRDLTTLSRRRDLKTNNSLTRTTRVRRVLTNTWKMDGHASFS